MLLVLFKVSVFDRSSIGLAVKNGLAGYVRNRGDAGVEILLEGEAQNIENFKHDLKEKKPPLAQIDSVKSD